MGGRGSTKERDEPLSPPSPPEGAPNRTGLRGRPGGAGEGGGVVKRKCLLPSREEPGMAGHSEGSRMWKHRRDTGCMGRGQNLGYWKQEEVTEAGSGPSPLHPKTGAQYPRPLTSMLPA